MILILPVKFDNYEFDGKIAELSKVSVLMR
jgi:hypothetical protein